MGFRRGGSLGGRSRRGPARPGARRDAPGTKGELARPAGARYAVWRGRSSSWKRRGARRLALPHGPAFRLAHQMNARAAARAGL